MMKVVVFHSYYGCETGCCGHVIHVDDQELTTSFTFSHPYGQDPIEFAKKLVTKELGAEHVDDLVWDECIISED